VRPNDGRAGRAAGPYGFRASRTAISRLTVGKLRLIVDGRFRAVLE